MRVLLRLALRDLQKYENLNFIFVADLFTNKFFGNDADL